MKYRLHLNLSWEVEVPDEVTNSEDILDELAERFYASNETVENIFWEGIEVEEV